MESTNVLSMEQIEHLMEAMRKNNIKGLKYQGIYLEQHAHDMTPKPIRMSLKPLPEKGEDEGEEFKAIPKKRPPTDDELLLNPYAGLDV